ncbi:MAG: ATP-binding protein [Prosthecobacter sp.]
MSPLEPAPPGGGAKDARARWHVVDCTQGGVSTTLFRLPQAVSARRVRLTLFFQSGQEGAFFRAFKMLATTDATPRLDGHWEPMFPVWFGSREDGDLVRDGHGLRLVGTAKEPIFKVDYSLPFDGMTGLRLEVSATGPENAPRPAVLTALELRHFNTFASNVALGCPVTSSHALSPGTYPDFLTDGLRGTYARPPAPNLGGTFFFEIDLKRQHQLDHLHLRTRADALESNRLSQLHILLYDRKPAPGVQPVWKGTHRPDGSLPDTSDEVVRATAGTGQFSGRYLRISSDGAAAFSPQIAEVEAYQVMVPLGVTATVNGRSWKADDTLSLPGGALWLTFAIDHPELSDPVGLGRRWKIAGFHDEWLAGNASGVVESRSPPPGEYEFQAQIRHSDLQWNTAIYRVPLVIPAPFWQRAWVRACLILIAAGLTALAAWRISRDAMARHVMELERRNELSAERARIARDMHDAVGSQLTQLTVLHEIVAEELGLTPEARTKLRQLTDTARACVAALDAVVWAVNPGNDTLANLAGYLTETAREYLTALGIACRQDVPHDWARRKVPSQTRHQLYLTFREALNNVVKHAQATEVTLTLRHERGSFTASIADNGIGLPADNQGPEKDGLSNMRTRLSAVGGTCGIRPRPGGGTIVEMQIPIPS